jgi:hypothetical protein
MSMPVFARKLKVNGIKKRIEVSTSSNRGLKLQYVTLFQSFFHLHMALLKFQGFVKHANFSQKTKFDGDFFPVFLGWIYKRVVLGISGGLLAVMF